MKHLKECVWEKTTSDECEYRDTHHYCPHPQHACNCKALNAKPPVEEKWKTVQKEIEINEGTLNYFGSYVDFVRLNDEKISVRLIIRKAPQTNEPPKEHWSNAPRQKRYEAEDTWESENFLDQFEERWRDKGDERYGLTKHNNTVLQRQIDEIREALQREREAGRKEWENINKQYLSREEAYQRGRIDSYEEGRMAGTGDFQTTFKAGQDEARTTLLAEIRKEVKGMKTPNGTLDKTEEPFRSYQAIKNTAFSDIIQLLDKYSNTKGI